MKDFDSLKIAVAGTGYVGLSLATLLAQHHQVTAVDIVPAKVDMINARKSPDPGRLHREVLCGEGVGPHCHAGW